MTKPALSKVTPIKSPYCEQAILEAIDRLPNAKCVCVMTLTMDGKYYADWGGGTVGDQHILTTAMLYGTLMSRADND